MVGEVGLAQREQAGDGGHQVVVHPQAAHRVMDGRVDPHRAGVGVLARDHLVHLEEVAVALADRVHAEPLDGVAQVQVHGLTGGAHAAAGVAHLLGGPRGHVARHQVAERRVALLQEVGAVGFRDVRGRTGVVGGNRHPDAAVVAQALAHQGQLGLVLARHRDAGGVDLHEARVGEQRAALVGAEGGGDVAGLGVGGQVIGIAIAAGGQQHRVRGVRLQAAVEQVAGDDAARGAVHEDHVQHLAPGQHPHLAGGDLPAERPVSSEQELLAGLAARVEGTRHLRSAERAVGQKPAVLARERHPLRHALVDDQVGDLGQPVDVGLARAVVAALDGVVEQPEDAVAVVGVILGGVDAALRGDAVRAPGAVLQTQAGDPVAHLRERGGGRRAGQPGAHHDHGVAAPVGRIDQLQVEAVLGPALGELAGRRASVERVLRLRAASDPTGPGPFRPAGSAAPHPLPPPATK